MSRKEAKVPIKGFGNLPDTYGEWMMLEQCLNDAMNDAGQIPIQYNYTVMHSIK